MSPASPGSTVSFRHAVTDRSPATAEEWARAVLERSPAALRWFLVAGWRLVLQLRLGPRSSADYVLGWRIEDRTPQRVSLVADSPLVDACNSVELADGVATWTTLVAYRRFPARVIWMLALPIHKASMHYLLRRAANSG
jgi:hypothetical protein